VVKAQEDSASEVKAHNAPITCFNNVCRIDLKFGQSV
jgi:hypothetical protein